MTHRTGGTVYGEPRKRLHPAVLALVGAAAVVLVAAVVFALTRTPDAPSSSAPPSPAPAPTSAAATSGGTSAEPLRLGVGTWLLSPADDPETHLTRSGGFAAMLAADPLVLSVVAGLADEACFSFRDPDGDYLRHFDYRLRFDAADDSDLFRQDATFCPVDDSPTIRLTSKNYPEHQLHRRGTQLYIDRPDDTGGFEFVVQVPPSAESDG
jgi:hypothetical protein